MATTAKQTSPKQSLIWPSVLQIIFGGVAAESHTQHIATSATPWAFFSPKTLVLTVIDTFVNKTTGQILVKFSESYPTCIYNSIFGADLIQESPHSNLSQYKTEYKFTQGSTQMATTLFFTKGF